MKKFNLVKSLTNLVNNRKGLLILCLSLATFFWSEAWGATATLNSSSNKTFGTTSGITFSISNLGNWTSKEDGGLSTSKHCAGYSVSKNTNAVISWSGIAAEKCLKITNVTIKATVASGTTLAFKNKKMIVYTSVSGSGTNKNITSSGNTSAQEVSLTEDTYLKDIGNGGSITMNSSDNTFYIESIIITYTLETLPVFYFKAQANKVGNGAVYASFTNGSFSSSTATTNERATKLSQTQSAGTYTAFFKAEETDDSYHFAGWHTDAACLDANRVSTDLAYSFTMPTNNKTTENDPLTKTLYANFVQSFTPEFNGSNQTLNIGSGYQVFSFRHTSTTYPSSSTNSNFYYVIKNEVRADNINTNPNTSHVIEYNSSTGELIACNAGTAEITFYQQEDNVNHIKAGQSVTYTITVSKNDNHISINGTQDSYQTSCFMDGYVQITSLTATNTDYEGSPISNNQTSGNDIATFYPDDKVVYSTYKLGDATWNVSQPENYKYKAANASFTIHVVKEAEETCNVATSSSTYWAKLGNTTDALTWTDKNAAKDLYFKASISTASTFNSIQVQQQINGNWENVGSLIDGKDNYPDGSKPVVTLSQAATGVRWKIAGSLGSDVTNVRITRKTYLNAADVTINTQEDNTTLVYPGNTGTGSFQVDYSLANGGDLKIVCDNPKFSIDKTSQTDVDCKSGSFDVKMTYTSQTAGTDYAHVVIYNNVYRKEITITGITQKHQQTLNWKPNFDQMSLGQEVSDAASSSHGAVTYISDNPDVIRVDNGTTLVAVKKGEAKIKATAAGDEEYEEKSIEKTISVTENHVQYIVWTQSLMGLKLGGEDKTLNAYATSEEEEGVASGRSITYTSDNTNVVSVSGNQLKIVGVGTANVTARQEGGNYAGITYDAVEKVNKVVVKDPSAQCESFVYEQDGNVEEFFQMNTSEITGTEHTLTGEPAKLTFNAKREYWKLITNFSEGNIVVDAYTSSGWQQVLDCGEPPIGSYKEYSINLNRDVTKIRFRRPSGGQGYHYIADAKIEQARYIETTTPATFQANVGEVQQQTITLNYSNITSDLLLSMAGGASSHFSVDKMEIEGDCGDARKNISLTITYTPTANTDDNIDGKETETLIISDGTTQCEVKLYGKAAKVDRDIVWDIADENNAYTVEQIALTATAETKLHQPAGEVAYNIVGASTQGCGTIENKVLSFNKNGIVYIEASTIASDKYNQATNIIKKWTVNLTPTEIITAPEIDGDIVYGTQLSDLKLKTNTGAARNTVNQQAVEGTFAITSGDISSAGEHTVTVTFTPTNTNMYASCTTTIPVSVLKANPSATAHAGEIIYGATVESSLLTNTGTTQGTWSWTDEKKDKVLAVGTYEGLQVHFTPSDAANYNEIDGVVSLTVIAATPVLSWTSAPTEADVNDKVVTYTATSNHAESEITYSITDGADYATIDANTGVLTITKAGTITVQALQAASTNYKEATLTTTTTLTGVKANEFTGNGDWNDPENWTNGVPTDEGGHPNVVISGDMTISDAVSVGNLTIENNGQVTITGTGSLSITGSSETIEQYGNLIVRNGGNVSISIDGGVTVGSFIIESSIGTTGTSISGQVTNGDKVIYTNGAYIDINMDPKGTMDDTQWYGFTVPFPVDVESGVYRKEGDTYRKCTYGSDYMIAEYDATQRLNTGKGWKYIKTGLLQPGHFYYFTVNGNYNTYRFKAAESNITTNHNMTIAINGDGPDANWNAVGNSTLTYVNVTGNGLPQYVQTYINGQSTYQVVNTSGAQFVVGCPFFIQASENTTMVLQQANQTIDIHYAPREETTQPMCVRIAPEGQRFSDQMYLTASEDALDEYELGLDLAKAGVGTKSAQLWVNAYGQQLCVNNAVLTGNQAYYGMGVYTPQAGNYELSLPYVPTNGTLYLLQDGYPIWNLNESPYTLECAKGTTNEYGLLFVAQEPQAPTGSQTISGNQSAQKILKDQQIYIQKNGTIFTISGQKVK